MGGLLKYGGIKERFSVLLTNSIRCNILELQGYKTELLEFVDISHSPKNLLIRAVKNNKRDMNIDNDKREIQNENNENDKNYENYEINEIMRIFGVNQTLYDLLNIK